MNKFPKFNKRMPPRKTHVAIIPNPCKLQAKDQITDKKSQEQNFNTINATTITNKILDDEFININNFLENLVKDIEIKVKDVGKSGFCREHPLYRIFMSYFIRKHLSNQLNIAITDRHTERILKEPHQFIIDTEPQLHNAIKHHYAIFKDPKTRAMEIIKSIKIVSVSHQIIFRNKILKPDYYVDEEKLWGIIKYFRKLSYRSVDLNPRLKYKYFYAYTDLIFDNEVIYDIKIKSKFQSCDQPNIPIMQFYHAILYGIGFYKKTGKMIKKFKIYNPLYGYEYSIELNINIDFELFEKLLEIDLEEYGRSLKLDAENVFSLKDLFKSNDHEVKPLKNVTKPVFKKSVFSKSTNENNKPNKNSATATMHKWKTSSHENSVLLDKNRVEEVVKAPLKIPEI